MPAPKQEATETIPTPQPLKQKRVEIKEAPDGLVYAYANHVAMGHTKFDVRLVFGQIRDVTEEAVVVIQHVQVTMTWAEAKILSDFLQANLKAFESLNGPLQLPEVPQKVVVPETFGAPQMMPKTQ
jgi:hypothetical protein